MVIKREDGSDFTTGQFQVFDPNSTKYDLFNSYDEELIRISGSPIFYYEIFIQFDTVDKLYLEDRNKIFSNFPIRLYGLYEPPEQVNNSTLFAIDNPDESIVIEMNYKAVLRDLGHPPKVGSRIYTPHRGENWIVIDRKLTVFQQWGAMHVALTCKKFQETTTTGEGNVTQAKPDVSIIPGS